MRYPVCRFLEGVNRDALNLRTFHRHPGERDAGREISQSGELPPIRVLYRGSLAKRALCHKNSHSQRSVTVGSVRAARWAGT
jgi:hypothetical protein